MTSAKNASSESNTTNRTVQLFSFFPDHSIQEPKKYAIVSQSALQEHPSDYPTDSMSRDSSKYTRKISNLFYNYE